MLIYSTSEKKQDIRGDKALQNFSALSTNQTLTHEFYLGFAVTLYGLEINRPARVRLYSSAAERSSDSARSYLVEPPNTIITDLYLEQPNTVKFDPLISCVNVDNPQTNALYLALEALADGDYTLTLLYSIDELYSWDVYNNEAASLSAGSRSVAIADTTLSISGGGRISLYSHGENNTLNGVALASRHWYLLSGPSWSLEEDQESINYFGRVLESSLISNNLSYEGQTKLGDAQYLLSQVKVKPLISTSAYYSDDYQISLFPAQTFWEVITEAPTNSLGSWQYKERITIAGADISSTEDYLLLINMGDLSIWAHSSGWDVVPVNTDSSIPEFTVYNIDPGSLSGTLAVKLVLEAGVDYTFDIYFDNDSYSHGGGLKSILQEDLPEINTYSASGAVIA